MSVVVGHWVVVTDSCGHGGLDYLLCGHDFIMPLNDAPGATVRSGELLVATAGYGRGVYTGRIVVWCLWTAIGSIVTLVFYLACSWELVC